MILKNLIKQGATLLEAAKINSPRSEAELIASFVLGQDKAWLLAHEGDQLTPLVSNKILDLIKLRAERQPMSYVLGEREFYGLTFHTDKRALTPRVETESIVEQVISSAPQNARVLDIGTGSGAIAIALKYHRPDLDITASEVSIEALDLARENAARLLRSEDQITFVASDLFDSISDKFDVVVANLPYVTREMELMPEVMNEPAVALFGGAPDGLDLYRKFFSQLQAHLEPTAWVYCESDPWQQPALIALAAKQSLQIMHQDYFTLGLSRTS